MRFAQGVERAGEHSKDCWVVFELSEVLRRTLRIGIEIADAKWYDIDSLPNVPSEKISVAGKLIRTFIGEVKKTQTD